MYNHYRINYMPFNIKRVIYNDSNLVYPAAPFNVNYVYHILYMSTLMFTK